MLRYTSLAVAAAAFLGAQAQKAGTIVAETHPQLPIQRCTASGCTTINTSIVLDSNWRWVHNASGTNCYSGSSWNTVDCPNGVTCAANCFLEGANYSGTYGITTSGNSLTLKFVTGTNVGSRVYLMANDNEYFMFRLLNQELTFDVDMSNLPCGLNGALYLVEMDADGGKSKYPSNTAGAKYGTGYCDAQCPHDIKFINGEANVENWNPSSTDPNSGRGRYGSCCPEMDIWEANSRATAFTPHPCEHFGQYRCDGAQECGDDSFRYNSVCDKDGCDFNSWRMGNQQFLGRGSGFTIDTTKKITVVTQFITNTGTATGTLSEIRRIYVQDGVIRHNSAATFPALGGANSLSDTFCNAQKTLFGDVNAFSQLGAHAAMGESMDNGSVLVMSVWDDHYAHMLWLNSDYPLDKDPSEPGVSRGPCPRDSGNPDDVEANAPNSSVTFSNIKFGDLNSTYSGTGGSSSSIRSSSTSTVRSSSTSTVRSSSTSTSTVRSSSTSTSTVRSSSTTIRSSSTSTSSSTTGAQRWGQCGGINWGGPYTCVSPWTCTRLNDWYYQCL